MDGRNKAIAQADDDWLETRTPHWGLEPSFIITGLTVDGQHRASGVVMDRVLGSSFFALTITACRGSALAMSRCKESNFYGLNVTNCSRIGNESAIVWNAFLPNAKKVDGTNHVRMIGGRVNYCDHKACFDFTRHHNTSRLRGNKISMFQIHESPGKGFKGEPYEGFGTPDPERVLFRIDSIRNRPTVIDSHFRYHHQAFGDVYPETWFDAPNTKELDMITTKTSEIASFWNPVRRPSENADRFLRSCRLIRTAIKPIVISDLMYTMTSAGEC